VITPSAKADGFSGNACVDHRYVDSRTLDPSALQNYTRTDMIPWARHTTASAVMPAITKRLWNRRSADTFLRGAVRSGFPCFSTSVLSFVEQTEEKQGPSSVENRFRQHSAGESFHVQIFNCDKSVSVHDLAGSLVNEVAPLLANVSVDSLERNKRFAAAGASFLPASYLSLRTPEFCLSVSGEARIGNLGSIGENGKGSQSNVYANRLIAGRERSCRGFNRKTDEPTPRFALDCDRLDCSRNWPVQLDLNVTGALDTQLTAIEQPAAIAVRREGDAVVTAERAKARESRLVATLYASKERLEGLRGCLKSLMPVLGD
jgi:hypothetical protein